MEFRRARHQEDPDRGLVARHEREIAPLLHQRWLFAESENFLLYDFYRPDGSVDENVFAYSNRRGEHRALVIYHNRFASTYGTIHVSASYADKGAGHLRQQTLGGAFGLPNDGNLFLAFRDNSTGLEHLERASKIVSQGYSLELHAYNCHVFLNWRELRPDENYRWDLLCDSLNGRGVPNLDDALQALEVAPLHDSLVALLQPDLVTELAELPGTLPACGQEDKESTPAAQLMQRVEALSLRFATEALAIFARKTGSAVAVDEKSLWLSICRQFHAVAGLPGIESEFPGPWSHEAKTVLPSGDPPLHPSVIWGPALGYAVLAGMVEAVAGTDTAATALALFDRLRLRHAFARAFSVGDQITEDGWRAAARIRLAFLYQTLIPAKPVKGAAQEPFAGLPREFWEDGNARWLLSVNESAGNWYFNKELHQQILWWTQLPDLLRLTAPAGAEPAIADKKTRQPAARATPSIKTIEQKLLDAFEQAEGAGFRIPKREEPAPKPAKREKSALAK
jgi:hypothetical protein